MRQASVPFDVLHQRENIIELHQPHRRSSPNVQIVAIQNFGLRKAFPHLEVDDGIVHGSGRSTYLFADVSTSKGQITVSHNSTEAEIIAMEYALRVKGLPMLDFGTPSCDCAPLVRGIQSNGQEATPTRLWVAQQLPTKTTSTNTRATTTILTSRSERITKPRPIPQWKEK